MNFKKISFAPLVVIAAGGILYVHAPHLLRSWLPKSWHSALRLPKEMPGSYIGKTVKASDWADPAALQQKLFSTIDERLAGTSSAQVKAFIQNPENRLILAQHALATTETRAEEKRKSTEESYSKTLDDLRRQLESSTANLPQGAALPPKVEARIKKTQARIEAIERELTSPHAVAGMVNKGEKNPHSGAEFIEKMTNNLDWMEQMIQSGETADFGNAMAIMEKIAKKAPEMMYNKLDRDIATAAALEYSRSNWAQDDAVDRALYFSKAWKEGRLNKVFGSLPLWQRRIVLGLKGKGEALGAGGNDKAGNLESLEYSLDNVHLPAYRYTGSCWQAPYRLNNVYGESIHGSGYRENFEEAYGNNFNQLTREVGGVCGGLSHYGATTATANGIPAMTAGEPGHCAYIVLVGDKWTPAYSLSWQRGLHWQVFGGNNKYSALHMATQLFSPEQKEKTELSQAMQNLGNAYAETVPEKAQQLYLNSVREQPLNYYAWREYAQFLAKSGQGTPAAWSEFCEELNRGMVSSYPEMAAEILKAHVYPELKKALADNPEELKKTLLSFWQNVKSMGPDAEWDKGNHGRWNVEEFCSTQLNTMGINPQKDPAIQDVFRSLLGTISGNTEYAPIILTWGNSLVEKMDKNMQSDFLASMLSGMGKGGATDATREQMLKPIILAAEKTGDIRSFQAVGKTLPETYRNPESKVTPPQMPDQLVSRGGIIQASSTSRFDNPCNHWGVLEPGVGGAFHTARDNDAWVKVTLPKQANITGIVLQTTTGNLYRHDNMEVQVSETGADNDWKTVAELGKCNTQTITFDLKATAPLAKYVRIMRKGGPEFFHLRGIFVYGKPAA